MIIISILIISIYSVLEGVRDGYYYDCTCKLDKQPELHPLFFIQRLFVFLLFFIYIYSKTGMFTGIVYIFSAICCFSFLHNGAYYTTRNYISGIYPDKWCSNSQSSTSIIELTFKRRIFFFVLGIINYILYYV